MLEKKIVQTDQAPAAIGPYSQAVVGNNMVYTSGQIAISPNTGELITQDIQAETAQVLDNLCSVLAASNSSMDLVVFCSVFVRNMQDYAKINEVYARYFSAEIAPARALVEVSALPKYVNVEISAIAMQKK